MKVAVVTEDGKTIVDHFGGSQKILVVTVEGGKIVNKELRNKPGHQEYAAKEPNPQTDATGKHGYGEEADKRHETMLQSFKDCEALIGGLMGTGAYEYFTKAGIKVILTDVTDVEEAVSLYAKGELKHIDSRLD